MDERVMPGTDQAPHADMVIASLLNAHISTINSEQQAIWQRYTAMLLANTVVFGVFTQVQAPTTPQVYFVSGFGVALCVAWLVSTISGFRWFSRRLEASKRFAWPALTAIEAYANPVNIGTDWAQGRRWIARMAVFVIGLFILAYAFLLAHHLYYTLLFFEGPR
jgi:hypothetical protein